MIMYRTTNAFMMGEDGVSHLFEVGMIFDTTAPVEVRFVFDDRVEWTFSRDLLILGMSEDAGSGDVRFRPEVEDGILGMHLDSPTGSASLSLAMNDVGNFITDTLVSVPPEQEDEIVTAALNRWIEEGEGVS